MALRNGVPLQHSPVGLSDAIDGTNVFAGAMAMLQNLIPDPTTRNLWQARPAAVKKYNFSDLITPGFVSALIVIGTRAYGMIASGRNAGQDEPFCYDIAAGAFQAITGITAANTPTSPNTSGAWTPPSMALVGTRIVVTHPGFNFGGGYAVGWLNISNPSALSWSAGNTATTALPALPTWVAQFNGRAHYLVNPATGQPGDYMSDALDPTTITNTGNSQIITFGDNQKLTCAAGLALFNQLGGIIQSLMVFKGSSNIYQVVGDPTTNNLTINSLNIATGTLSPLSVTETPKGLAFLAPDGLRLIDFDAKVSDPIGMDGAGINAPFQYSTVPSRAVAACNNTVLRVSVQNGLAAGSPNQEYWYDIPRQKWSGPHTFPAAQISPYNGNTFIMTPVGVTASLWQSDITQSNTSTFVENGNQMSFTWASVMLPDTKQMAEYANIESTLNMQLVNGQTPISVQALDQNGSILNSVLITSSGAGTLWGQFNWGQALWGGAQNALAPRQLKWTQPLVFRRLQISATGQCVSGFKIGDLFMRYQQLGYLQVA